MKQKPIDLKKRLAELNAELATLQKELAKPTAAQPTATGIHVRVTKNQARFIKVRKKGAPDTGVGKFYLEIDITALSSDVYLPLSVASGKKVAGFMYQIEGTAAASIVTTSIKVSGKQVSQITLGTLRFAKIPATTTASFTIQLEIKGSFNKTYQIVFTRLNYKHTLTDARYQQYLTPITSKSVKFS